MCSSVGLIDTRAGWQGGWGVLLAAYPTVGSPEVDEDDLDMLDPWVIVGRYAADLPELEIVEANELLAALQHIVDRVRKLIS